MYQPSPHQLRRIEEAFGDSPSVDAAFRFGQHERIDSIRRAAQSIARDLVATCPYSRELNSSLKSLEESVFWAEAAIIRREK